MWKIKHEAPHGYRIGTGYMWVSIEHDDSNLWWFDSAKKWLPLTDENRKIYGGCNSCMPCKSIRAFKKFLRKQKNLRSVVFTLNSRYHVTVKGETYNICVTARWEE